MLTAWVLDSYVTRYSYNNVYIQIEADKPGRGIGTRAARGIEPLCVGGIVGLCPRYRLYGIT